MLIDFSSKNPEYGILGPMLIDSTKNNISPKFEAYFNGIQDPLFIEDVYFNRSKDIYPIKMLPAAVWLIPRRTLIKVGGFDPIFYHYGEDDNYMQRVLFHGLKIGICPNVRVVHDTEQRVNKTNTTNQDQFKNLLVEFCDINKSNSPVAFLLYSFLKAFLKALKFRFNLSEKLLTGGIYIFKLKKKIAESRNQNIKVYRSWL